jgi:hypothetical protein
MERSLQSSAVRWLNKQPRTRARVNGPGPAHVAGDPDVYGCVAGRMFQIELKAPRGVVSPIQKVRLAEWGEADAVVAVCRSMDEVRAVWAECATGPGEDPVVNNG